MVVLRDCGGSHSLEYHSRCGTSTALDVNVPSKVHVLHSWTALMYCTTKCAAVLPGKRLPAVEDLGGVD